MWWIGTDLGVPFVGALRWWVPLMVGPLLVAGLAVIASGCGSGEVRRYPITGSVTFDGKPVPAGTISFEPVGRELTPGFANIVDGKYDTAVNGVGHLGGEQVVRITGDARPPVDPNSFQADSYVAKPLFQPYQTNADLPARATQLDFDVPRTKKK